jgi:hypothetical protein
MSVVRPTNAGIAEKGFTTEKSDMRKSANSARKLVMGERSVTG